VHARIVEHAQRSARERHWHASQSGLSIEQNFGSMGSASAIACAGATLRSGVGALLATAFS